MTKAEIMAAVWEVTGGEKWNYRVKVLLYDLFFGQEATREDTQSWLKQYLEGAIDCRDADFLEYVGRNIPVKGDPPPKKTAKVKIAEYLQFCVARETPEGVTVDEEDPYIPKRKEVADELSIDVKRVSEFYSELAKKTGLDLDERKVGSNVWS